MECCINVLMKLTKLTEGVMEMLLEMLLLFSYDELTTLLSLRVLVKLEFL